MACDGSEREQRRQVELRWSDALTRGGDKLETQLSGVESGQG
jgi:hypothetical protein